MTEEELMLTSILNCRRVDLFLEKRPLNRDQKVAFERMQQRRIKGEPLQYIIGHTEFCGLKIFVDPRVLIPRPETELMVEAALDIMQKSYSGRTFKILDLGTGSGNIAIAISQNFPDAEVIAVDASMEALNVARRNAHFHHVYDRITFIHEDMNEALQKNLADDEKYDLIISNPPYIPEDQMQKLPNDVKCEPYLALEGGDDGLKYIRNILSYSPNILKNSGKLMVEFWDGQSKRIFELYEYYNAYRHIEFCKDYRKTNRFFIARLQEPESVPAGNKRLEDYY